MLTTTGAFAGLSVDDLDAAFAFYRDTLGLPVERGPNGLHLKLDGATVFLYPKDDHEPATYTALYLEVPDIDAAVRDLAEAGVPLERYEGMPQDESGVMRGREAGMGPDIAWFRDPARNIVGIVQE